MQNDVHVTETSYVSMSQQCSDRKLNKNDTHFFIYLQRTPILYACRAQQVEQLLYLRQSLKMNERRSILLIKTISIQNFTASILRLWCSNDVGVGLVLIMGWRWSLLRRFAKKWKRVAKTCWFRGIEPPRTMVNGMVLWWIL